MVNTIAEDPIVVCISIMHTQTKEIDTDSFQPHKLSQSRAYGSRMLDRGPDCKVTALVDGKRIKIDGWRGRSGTRFVHLQDAPAAIAATVQAKLKFLERQLESYKRVLADPSKAIPLHRSEVA